MSLESELGEIRVTALEIGQWIGVQKDTTVADTVGRMRDEKTNCALVQDGKKLVGIFTDHDVFTKVLGQADTWQKPVSEIMTANPKTVSRDSGAAAALEVMDGNRIRNVPIVDANGEVVGNIDQQSFVRYLSDRFHMHVYNQPPEPDQYARTRHGA